MALTLIPPSGIDPSGNYTVNGITVSANASIANLTVTTTSNLGAVGNIYISGGTANYVLQTDGAGTLTWAAQSGGGNASNIANGNSNVSIATSNGNVTTSVAGNANIIVVTGTGVNVAGTLNATGNLTAGNIITSGSGGNITDANVVSANLFVGSGANLTSLAGANVTGTVPLATTAGTVTTAAQPNITSTGTLTGLTMSGAIAMGNSKITGLATPTADADATTKAYVDSVAQGLDLKASVVAGTTSNITLSGTQTIDGISVIAGDRVLVKNQTAPADNGIYLCAAGAWTRTTDMDTWAEVPGAFTFVEGGTTQADTGWVCTSDAGGTIGVTAITWTQFSSAGSYYAGTGLTLTGSTFSVNASQTQITSVGTLGSLTVTGNISAGNVSATTFTGALTGAATTAGTVTTAAQGNITSVGTLTSLDSSGTITAPAFTANTGVFTGNANGLSSLVGANVTGTVPLATSATTAGTVTTAAQPNITSTGTLTSLTVSGNTTSGNFVGVFANGNSNVSITSANGNINLSAVGNANVVVVTGTGVNVAGTLNTTGNTTFTGANVNLGAVANLHISGGTSNYVLQTDGAGTLTWASVPGGANVTVDNFTGNGVQTIFTLSTTPIGINQTSVNYNGATVLRADYTLANANITFSSAPANGSYIEVTTFNLTASGGTSAAAAVGYSLIFGG